MAAALYDKAREGFGNAQIDWTNDDIRVYLVDACAYTVNLATHDFLDDIPGGARIAGPVALASKTNTAGVMDAADIQFTGVTGASIEAIVAYKHTGVEATSRLIFYDDGATGLPVTPNGGTINVAWSNGSNKIFKL